MTGFAALLAEAEEIEGGFAFDITDDWLQGRTAYGGLTSALALAAAQRVDPELPPLRSGQFAMIAPLAGRVEARARIVRKGRNATWVAAELSNEKGVGFSASFVFMRQIESAADIAGYPLPEGVSPVADAKPVPMDHAPQFLKQNFDARFALPKSALGEADLCWWVRLRARENLDPALEAVLVGMPCQRRRCRCWASACRSARCTGTSTCLSLCRRRRMAGGCCAPPANSRAAAGRASKSFSGMQRAGR